MERKKVYDSRVLLRNDSEESLTATARLKDAGLSFADIMVEADDREFPAKDLPILKTGCCPRLQGLSAIEGYIRFATKRKIG